MLLGTKLLEPQRLALRHRRQGTPLALFALFFFFAVGGRFRQLIDAEEAVEFLNRTRSAEGVVAGGNVDAGLVEDCRKYLRGDEALPDELIELEDIIVEKFTDVFRRAAHIGRADRFVRFLRVFFRLVKVGLLGKIVRPEALRNQLADLRQRVVRDAHGIRAHVSDQRDGAFVAELHAFIQALRQGHGALGREAQAVVRGLLEF